MTNTIEKENKEICKLININKDAYEFYHSAQLKAEDESLKLTFRNLESLHKSVVLNLRKYVEEQGGDPEIEETAMGQARQFWGELMAKISNDVDQALVNNLEEAEDRCLHSIEDTLEDSDISTATKTMLRSEKQTLQKSHDYMKSLKDMLKAA